MVRRGRRDQRDAAIRGEQRYLGELQARIMEVAWERGRITVRDALDSLGHDREIAYTTVMTVMTRLADEGVLARELVGKGYVYRPSYTREEFRAGISGSIVSDLVADFGEVALSQFVDALEQADPAQLARLRLFLDERDRADGGA